MAESNLMKWITKKKEVISDYLSETKVDNSKYNHPFYYDLLSKGNDIKGMKDREFSNTDEVMMCFSYYRSIIVAINKHGLFVPTIENFCMFMGWTARIYKQMLNHPLIEVREVMQMIDDYILEAQLSAGQTGWAKANLTKFRAQVAGEHGNALVTQKEYNDDKHKSEKGKSKEQLLAELESMGAKKPLPSIYDKNNL